MTSLWIMTHAIGPAEQVRLLAGATDADAAPELEIQLTGTKTLTAGDFRP